MDLTSDADAAWSAHLKSRWPARSVSLGRYALGGSLVFFVLDWVLTRGQPAPPSLGAIAAVRLGWVALPAAGILAVRAWPQARLLPAWVVALSLAWCWGNEWAFFHLGLSGSVVQAIAVIAFCVTAATFLPLRLPSMVLVFTWIALGHVAMDLAWPQATPLGMRLWTDAAVLAFVTVEIVLFQNLAANQRRGVALRADLEKAMAALEAARARREQELQERVQQATQQVKVLSGLLPICAWCKSVRDDSGYWERIEAYVSEHSQASFTHSICPKCTEKIFAAEEPPAK